MWQFQFIVFLFFCSFPHESTKQRRTASVGNMSKFIITSILTVCLHY